MKKEFALLQLLVELNQLDMSVNCKLVKQFNSINAASIHIGYINPYIFELISQYGFKIVNVGTLPTSKLLSVEIEYVKL